MMEWEIMLPPRLVKCMIKKDININGSNTLILGSHLRKIVQM